MRSMVDYCKFATASYKLKGESGKIISIEDNPTAFYMTLIAASLDNSPQTRGGVSMNNPILLSQKHNLWEIKGVFTLRLILLAPKTHVRPSDKKIITIIGSVSLLIN